MGIGRALGMMALCAGCDMVAGLSDFEVGPGTGGVGGVGGVGGSGGGGAGSGGVERCMVGPGDTFDGNALDMDVWGSSLDGQNVVLQVSGGLATFSVGDAGLERYLTVGSRQDIALQSCGIEAELPQVPATVGLHVFFGVEAPGAGAERRWVRMEVVDHTLYGRFMAPDFVETGSVPYDPDAHVRWRVEEAGGEVTWLVSSDGLDWTEIARGMAPFDLAEARLVFGAGAYTAAAFDAAFGSINVK